MNNKLKNFNYKQQGNFSPIFSTRSVSIVSFPLFLWVAMSSFCFLYDTFQKMKSELSKDNYIYVLLERNSFFFSFSFF